MKRYWFELTDEHYNDLGAAISDGWQKSPAIAEAKRWMKENGVKAAILVCNSMATDNILDMIHMKKNKNIRIMTQQEFMERTGITPTAEDFDYIHAVYLNTSMNKDEFCKDFKKHGDSRIIRDVHVRVLNYEMKCERQKEVIDNLTDFLIGKAHAYDDTDFRKEAVRLAGEVEVVKRTIELGLPLWDEDRKVVLSMIEEQGK